MKKTEKLTELELEHLRAIQDTEAGLGVVVALVGQRGTTMEKQKKVLFDAIKKRLDIPYLTTVYANSMSEDVEWDDGTTAKDNAKDKRR